MSKGDSGGKELTHRNRTALGDGFLPKGVSPTVNWIRHGGVAEAWNYVKEQLLGSPKEEWLHA